MARESTIREKIRSYYESMHKLEQELAELRREMNMTSGPKKMALEMMRQKIEESSGNLRKILPLLLLCSDVVVFPAVVAVEVQQLRHQKKEAEDVLADINSKLDDAETNKAKLCEDLRLLIEQDTQEQFAKLEEITQKLEALGTAFANLNCR